MSRKDYPVFSQTPSATPSGDVLYPVDPGMTLREYFAALAMQGMRAQAGVHYNAEERRRQLELTAEWAVEQADALLAALAKERA